MPEENGVTQQLNHTLLEHTRAMPLTAQLPNNLWPENIHHTVQLKNRTSTQALNSKTPYKGMHNAMQGKIKTIPLSSLAIKIKQYNK